MANFTKTQDIVILPHTRIIHPGSVIGTVQTATTEMVAMIMLYHGFVQNQSNADPGIFKVQISPSASEDDNWLDYRTFVADDTAPDEVTISGSEAIDQTEIQVGSTANFAQGDLLYIQDTNGGSPQSTTGSLSSPETQSEWAECDRLGTSPVAIHLLDGLRYAKDSQDIIRNDANRFFCRLPLEALVRFRVVFRHQGGTGCDCDVKAIMVRGDSFG